MGKLTIELDVGDRVALVVGAGEEITAKIERLVKEGARVRVVAAAPDARVDALAAQGAIDLRRRAFDARDLERAFVVFVAPGEIELGARLAAEGLLVCTVDRPEASTFTNVAVAEVSGLRVTVGTRGASPAVAKRLREDLEAALSEPRLARFVAELAARREALPRGERARAMSDAAQGFALDATLRYPDWFER